MAYLDPHPAPEDYGKNDEITVFLVTHTIGQAGKRVVRVDCKSAKIDFLQGKFKARFQDAVGNTHEPCCDCLFCDPPMFP